jgi:hypothetical protein
MADSSESKSSEVSKVFDSSKSGDSKSSVVDTFVSSPHESTFSEVSDASVVTKTSQSTLSVVESSVFDGSADNELFDSDVSDSTTDNVD